LIIFTLISEYCFKARKDTNKYEIGHIKWHYETYKAEMQLVVKEAREALFPMI